MKKEINLKRFKEEKRMMNEEEKKIDQDFFKSIEKEETGVGLDDEDYKDLDKPIEDKKEVKEVTQEITDDKKEAPVEAPKEESENEKPKEDAKSSEGEQPAKPEDKKETTEVPKVDGEAQSKPATTGQEPTK